MAASPKKKKKVVRALPSARGAEASRAVSAKARSEKSQESRRKNILAGTPNKRIKGHLGGSQRAAQAKRDAKQRGD